MEKEKLEKALRNLSKKNQGGGYSLGDVLLMGFYEEELMEKYGMNREEVKLLSPSYYEPEETTKLNNMEKEKYDNLLKDGDDYRNQKAKKVFENCFISVTHGQPNILLNNHDLKELYDAMDSVFFEDVEWSWEFGENHLENGVYKCAITITDQDEWGIYFYIDQISLVSSF